MKGTIFVSMKSKNNTQSVNLLVETNVQFFLSIQLQMLDLLLLTQFLKISIDN